LTGQFLSPDNNIQNPEFTQNFNRYGYCINNPLKYADPDGEFFLGTIFTFVGDFLGTTLFHGGLSVNRDVRNNAWKDFDPSAKWSATNKAWKIDWGGFITDPNRNFWGRSWQLISRWTWELPQTLTGKLFAHTRNVFGKVDNVEYFAGVTLVNRNNPKVGGGGMTLGPYILGTNLKASTTDLTFMHEYGHTIQSRFWGPAYGLFIAPVSGMDMLLGGQKPASTLFYTRHDLRWYERQANRYAATYFGNEYDIVWNHEENPVWIPPYEYGHRERPSVLTLNP
jgi:hypothetical protein